MNRHRELALLIPDHLVEVDLIWGHHEDLRPGGFPLQLDHRQLRVGRVDVHGRLARTCDSTHLHLYFDLANGTRRHLDDRNCLLPLIVPFGDHMADARVWLLAVAVALTADRDGGAAALAATLQAAPFDLGCERVGERKAPDHSVLAVVRPEVLVGRCKPRVATGPATLDPAFLPWLDLRRGLLLDRWLRTLDGFRSILAQQSWLETDNETRDNDYQQLRVHGHA